MQIGVVAIGRNEGERLIRCLTSLPSEAAKVYVDSGSNDGSPETAIRLGAEVVYLSAQLPFTAARARNQGFERLGRLVSNLEFVQFVDGDCELDQAWVQRGLSFLHQHPEVAAVAGRRRERFPEQSVYNWLCDHEWNRGEGEVKELGGDMLIRAGAFRQVGGYRDDLIAGEEPELCVRLRSSGWRVWRLGAEMTRHDAAITSFRQWWKRAVRSGYAFAQGADLHGGSPERHYVWECRRSWLWAVVIPILCLAVGIGLSPWGWLAFLVFPAQIVRQALRTPGSPKERLTISAFQMVARFAEAWGQVRYWRNRLLGREGRLIEYK